MRLIRWLAATALLFGFAADLPADERSRSAVLKATTRPEAVRAMMHLQPDEAVVQIALARTLPPALTPKDRERLENVARDLRQGNFDRAQRRWSKLMGAVAGSAAPIDVNALVQWVLRESYLETNKDLRFHAEKVRFYNEQKQAIREHVGASRGALAGMRRNEKVLIPKIALAPSFKKKKDAVRVHGEKKLSAEELAEEIEKWEQQLASVGDDAQLANIDLQNALQKQQQTLQAMSNVSKMLHDTAMAVIRKIG